MKTIWVKNIAGKIVPVMNVICYTDDSFGNLVEAAGSYFMKNQNEDLLHSDMMRVNYIGALYHYGISSIV